MRLRKQKRNKEIFRTHITYHRALIPSRNAKLSLKMIKKTP